jgi:hypothetical protein
MDLDKLISSEEYREASRRVAMWKERLAGADRADALKVRDEKAAFFKAMRRDSPDLYLAFQVGDKELSELIYRKMTGRGITID